MPREIVLGVRDHVSPHGRVTVEVRDDRTGRVKRRVRDRRRRRRGRHGQHAGRR